MIKITGFIWRWKIVGKLAWKHHLTVEEVEEVFETSRAYSALPKDIIMAKTCMPPEVKQTRDGIYSSFLYTKTTAKP